MTVSEMGRARLKLLFSKLLLAAQGFFVILAFAVVIALPVIVLLKLLGVQI